MQTFFLCVWYASEDTAKRRGRMKNSDDTGELEVSPTRLRFRGCAARLEFPNPKAVTVFRRPVPWFVMFTICLFAVSCNGLGWLFELKDQAGLLAVSISTLGIAMIAFFRDRWIDVQYEDDQGQVSHVYFTDASALGWGKILGGPERMCKTIREVLASAPAPDHHFTANPSPRPLLGDGPADIIRVCEGCGQPTQFPERERGKVQHCSCCGVYLNVPAVGEVDDSEDE